MVLGSRMYILIIGMFLLPVWHFSFWWPWFRGMCEPTIFSYVFRNALSWRPNRNVVLFSMSCWARYLCPPWFLISCRAGCLTQVRAAARGLLTGASSLLLLISTLLEQRHSLIQMLSCRYASAVFKLLNLVNGRKSWNNSIEWRGSGNIRKIIPIIETWSWIGTIYYSVKK